MIFLAKDKAERSIGGILSMTHHPRRSRRLDMQSSWQMIRWKDLIRRITYLTNCDRRSECEDTSAERDKDSSYLTDRSFLIYDSLLSAIPKG